MMLGSVSGDRFVILVFTSLVLLFRCSCEGEHRNRVGGQREGVGFGVV